MDSLNTCLVKQVCSHLDINSIANLSMVNKKLNKSIDYSYIMSLLKEQVQKDLPIYSVQVVNNDILVKMKKGDRKMIFFIKDFKLKELNWIVLCVIKPSFRFPYHVNAKDVVSYSRCYQEVTSITNKDEYLITDITTHSNGSYDRVCYRMLQENNVVNTMEELDDSYDE